MPTKTIPTLGAVAEAQADEKKRGKLAQAISVLSAALGLTAEAKPAAKMTKKTLTTKRVEMEESDEEEAEEEDPDEESTGSESDSESPADEEDGESASAEEEGQSEGAEAEAEDADDKAFASAVSKALNSPAVHAAFLAALPRKYRAVGALYSPHRLASAAKKATSQKTTFAAMGELAKLNQRAKGNSQKILAAQAKLENRLAKVEGERRADRVSAIVLVAKEKGVPGATTRQGREMLRAYGMQHGTKALSEFIQSQGPGLRRRERVPGADTEGNAIGQPSTDEQKRMMDRATAGMSAKDRAEFEVIAAEKIKGMNGAAEREEA